MILIFFCGTDPNEKPPFKPGLHGITDTLDTINHQRSKR